MKQFSTDFIFDYLFGNSNDKLWYKFERNINKSIKNDLKAIKKNNEVTKNTDCSSNKWYTDKLEPVVIIKGKYETYWRVYFINYTYSYVVYSTPNGHTFIEELSTAHDNINNIWQKDTFPCASDYYTSTHNIDYKIKSLQFIKNWLSDNAESVEDENYKFITRLK